MSVFNPYSARVKPRLADNANEGSSNGQPLDRLTLAPVAETTGLAADRRVEKSGHAEDPLLDDFGRLRYPILSHY